MKCGVQHASLNKQVNSSARTVATVFGSAICSVAVCFGLVYCLRLYFRPSEAAAKNGVTIISVKDIPHRVVINGTLGEPLGTLLTIQGIWVNSVGENKGSDLDICITMINSQPCVESIILDGELVRHFDFYAKGRGPVSAGDYDWRGGAGGDLIPPVPEAGEVWELLGVQTGFFEDFSSDVWKEFTGIPLPRPYSLSGFVTPFEYIAVKKLGGGDKIRPLKPEKVTRE